MDSEHITLVANTVATVTLPAGAGVEVLNRNGAAEVYFTINGPAPTVGGEDTYMLPASVGALEIEHQTSMGVVIRTAPRSSLLPPDSTAISPASETAQTGLTLTGTRVSAASPPKLVRTS